MPKKKKGGRRKKGKRRGDDDDDFSDDDMTTDAASARTVVDVESIVRGMDELQPEAVRDAILESNHDIRDVVEADTPHSDEMMGELTSEMRRRLKPMFKEAVKSALDTIVKGDTASRKVKMQTAEKDFAKSCAIFQGYARNAALLWSKADGVRSKSDVSKLGCEPDDPIVDVACAAMAELEYTILRTAAFGIIQALMSHQYACNGVTNPPELKRTSSDGSDTKMDRLEFPAVKRLSKCLPPASSKIFEALAAAASPPIENARGDDTENDGDKLSPTAKFLAELQEAALYFSVRVPAVDKKASRAESHGLRMETIERAKSSQDAQILLHHALALLIYKAYKAMLPPSMFAHAGSSCKGLVHLLKAYLDDHQGAYAALQRVARAAFEEDAEGTGAAEADIDLVRKICTS